MNQDDSSPEPAPHAGAEPTTSVGELLIAARERWNYSAADIARQLRLALRQIEALEANHFDALPGNTFVRGFIRNYAKAVQEDPEALLAAYEQMRPAPELLEFNAPTEHIDFNQRPTPKWVWYSGALIVLALAIPVGIYLALHDEEVAKPHAATTSIGHVALPASAVMQSQSLAANTSAVLATSALAPSAASATVATPVVSPAASAQPSPPGAAASNAVTAAAAAPGDATSSKVSMKFEGDAWVEVRDRKGKKIFSQLNLSGSAQTVEGQAPFSLVVGNAAQVRIAYNGKPVDLAPYIKVNVARLTLE